MEFGQADVLLLSNVFEICPDLCNFCAFKTERTAYGCNQFNVDASFSGTFLSKALLYHDHSGGPGEKQMFG